MGLQNPGMKLLLIVCLGWFVVTAQSQRLFRATRNETVDLWETGNQDNCPPFPNCAPGFTCWVYQHPENCPVCRCVPCAHQSCIPRQGEICRWSEDVGVLGCGGCRCEPCQFVSNCEPACRQIVPRNGCAFCKCPNPEKELGEHQHANADVDEMHRQGIEVPRGAEANPADP